MQLKNNSYNSIYYLYTIFNVNVIFKIWFHDLLAY